VEPADRRPVTQLKGDFPGKKTTTLALAALFTFSMCAVASPLSDFQDQPKKEEKKDEKKPAPKKP
jgi:hypothetical protein